ncbi:hypothetical protein ACFLYU_01115 [Candidatus Dependentiae bacterium]
MNALKYILMISFILSPLNISPKVYYKDGKKVAEANVLDVGIFLDDFIFVQGEGYTSQAKKNETDPIFQGLIETIEDEEAIIACSNLVRCLISFEKEKFAMKKWLLFGTQVEKVLSELNNKNKWLIYKTLDGEYVVLIPIKKYGKVKRLAEIGINDSKVTSIKAIDKEFYEDTEKQQIKNIVIEKDIEKMRSESLLNIFSNNPKIVKRVYLSGHGFFSKEIQATLPEIKMLQPKEESFASIATMSPHQYIKFLERLKNIGCSFLFVNSCFSGGWNALASQTAGFYEQKNIFKKFEHISKTIPFIIVVSSLPDEVGASAVTEHKIKISDFFRKLNMLFEKEVKAFKKEIAGLKGNLKKQRLCRKKSFKDIVGSFKKGIKALYENNEIKIIEASTPKEWKELHKAVLEVCNKKIKDINEIDVLTGKLLTPIYGRPLTIIDKKPWLLKAIHPILINLTKEKRIENLSSIRFPGKPFFRVENAFEELKKKYVSEEIEKLGKLFSLSSIKKEKLVKKEKELEVKIRKTQKKEDKKALKEELEKTMSQISNINSILNYKVREAKEKISKKAGTLVISYPFLIDHQLKHKDEPITITMSKELILLYPSIINLSIKMLNPKAKIISMIPGRAQHFIKSIDLDFEIEHEGKTSITDLLDKFYEKHFYSRSYALIPKLFFIGKISFVHKQTKKKYDLENVVFILGKGVKNYIYKSKGQYYLRKAFHEKVKTKYFGVSEQTIYKSLKMYEKEAKKIIHQWVLKTTPAKEAIHEATAGIENIYKIRRRINQVIPGTFSEKELVSIEKKK